MFAVAGTRVHAEALCEEIAEVLSPMDLHLSLDKTVATHIDEGSSLNSSAPSPMVISIGQYAAAKASWKTESSAAGGRFRHLFSET